MKKYLLVSKHIRWSSVLVTTNEQGYIIMAADQTEDQFGINMSGMNGMKLEDLLFGDFDLYDDAEFGYGQMSGISDQNQLSRKHMNQLRDFGLYKLARFVEYFQHDISWFTYTDQNDEQCCPLFVDDSQQIIELLVRNGDNGIVINLKQVDDILYVRYKYLDPAIWHEEPDQIEYCEHIQTLLA